MFTLPAIKVTEHRLRITPIKAGVTEDAIRSGLQNYALIFDDIKREIRDEDGEVWARFGDMALSAHGWKIPDGQLKE